MSYDLFFTSPPISRAEFEAWFKGRAHYKMNDGQAWYANDDTGVYFCFEHTDVTSWDDEDNPVGVAFNLNFFRPSYFVLEAEHEVTQFVQHFGCSIHDPQMDGMGDGPYTPQGLISGWHHGNEFGYQAYLGKGRAPEVVLSRPGAELEAIWKWNFMRTRRTDASAKDIFVPVIRLAVVGEGLFTTCVWPDGISTLIPEVDCLLVPRSQLAPKKFLGGKKDDMCIVPWADALPIIQTYQVEGYEFATYELPSPDTPEGIKVFVRSLSPSKAAIQLPGFDEVLDRELVERYWSSK